MAPQQKGHVQNLPRVSRSLCENPGVGSFQFILTKAEDASVLLFSGLDLLLFLSEPEPQMFLLLLALLSQKVRACPKAAAQMYVCVCACVCVCMYMYMKVQLPPPVLCLGRVWK